jgi:lysozyme
MKTTDSGLVLIKHHEGVRYKPYRCPAKLWTIGVGHLMYPEQAKLPMEDRMGFPLKPEHNRQFSKEEVDGILALDLAGFERGVERFCGVLTPNKNDALISFAFNLGLGTLQRSTLRQKVLRGDYESAAEEFLKYTKAGGKVLPGLVKRRNDERALFLNKG